ncbi:hypothetical protein N7520_011330 [Penicillium odoratum]|uniref:uncharacterized protein n=1 Tax=Penicillium odoratum TaxID=1167516 RepID=UPI002548B5B8|nr:uncharacterized protein N7520_011330 [Penicillium odoratum]KAJ5746148.1 hypothetical protein N7520_011330 [Penicillium odoratum]
MSRSLPKRTNPLILSGAAPAYEELLARRRLGKTNLSVKSSQVGTSNATKPENLGLFEYAHLRAPLPKDLKGSEIFPSHNSQQHPETYFLMRRSKDGFVSATGMFKIAFPWAKAEEERTEREYLKAREYTSLEEVAGNVWISPVFALELSREYQMYDWVRALLDPTDIAQSPTKKQITPPPKFELPSSDDLSIAQRRSRRSVSPTKKSSSSPRKARQPRSTKETPSTPSTSAANESLQQALEVTASSELDLANGILESVEEEVEVKTTGSPEKKKGRKSKKAAEAGEEKEEAKEKESKKEEKKEDKKAEKKKKKDVKESVTDVEVDRSANEEAEVSQATLSLDMPITLPEVPSAKETEEMIAKAKAMVEDAIKIQTSEDAAAGSPSVKLTKKRKSEDDDEETAAEASQRVKKAKVLEEKLKRERVRNRALFGVSAAFALAASIPYFF